MYKLHLFLLFLKTRMTQNIQAGQKIIMISKWCYNGSKMIIKTDQSCLSF